MKPDPGRRELLRCIPQDSPYDAPKAQKSVILWLDLAIWMKPDPGRRELLRCIPLHHPRLTIRCVEGSEISYFMAWSGDLGEAGSGEVSAPPLHPLKLTIRCAEGSEISHFVACPGDSGEAGSGTRPIESSSAAHCRRIWPTTSIKRLTYFQIDPLPYSPL